MTAGLITKTFKDGAGNPYNSYLFDDGTGVLTSVHQVQQGEAHIGQLGGTTIRVSASFTLPNTVLTYAGRSSSSAGSLVANSTAVGSVVPLALPIARKNGGSGSILSLTLWKSSNDIFSISSAVFRAHIYNVAPTLVNGDGGVWQTTSIASGLINYIGFADISVDKQFSDGSAGVGMPKTSDGVSIALPFQTAGNSQNVYAVLEAIAPYKRLPGETLMLTAYIQQD